MDSNSRQLAEDLFVRTPVNAKISKKHEEKNESSSPALRVEMQTLRLSGESQNCILETLRYIYGENFELKDSSNYKDKGSNLNHRYWMERGTLVVQGGIDYSKRKSDSVTTENKFRMYALNKLETYGFHKTHCVEALDHTNGQIDEALEILYDRYHNIDRSIKIDCEMSLNEMSEQRSDEKAVLDSIFESGFKEKEPNTLWEFTLDLSYLLKYYNNSKEKVSTPRKENINYNNRNNNFKTKKIEICRNFSKGITCKYGERCRFLHEKNEPVISVCDELGINKFECFLEIKFRKDTKYPFEPPVILLKTTAPSNIIPQLSCLHICRRLITEAESLARDGIPSVYSIVDLLKNEDEIISFLSKNTKKFIDSYQPLLPSNEDKSNSPKRILPSHYEKAPNRDNKAMFDLENISKEDNILAKRHLEKQNNSQYTKMIEERKKLPAWNKMVDILEAVKSSQVVVISGETGCGKSTQVPQFILDEWLNNKIKEFKNGHIEIICTQPRRISAIGVADRVAEERIEKTGNTIGYQIRLESKVSSKTRLTFCTTGVLLRRLESDPQLNSVTHILVDEVHERSEESDFLLLILKDLITKRKDLRVILMSATLNADLFSNYFGEVPVLEIPGRTFPVQQFFLEDILDMSKYIVEENSKYMKKLKKGTYETLEIEMKTCDVLAPNAMPKINIRDENLTLAQILARYNGYTPLTCKNMYLMDYDKVNLELIEHILEYIVEGNHDWPKEGSIVVFLPGISEITSLHDQLNDNKLFNSKNGKFVLIPLHSTLTSEEQAAVFQKPKNGARKIVLSTNIAETSITIDDCVFVIDCGKMKEKRFDSNRNMESLDMIWVSKANAKQRKGRAGRVMPGICIHLFTSHRFEHHMLNQPVPELHRVPLEQLILRTKVLPLFQGMSVHKVLGGTIEPPSEESINSALVRLQDVGALDRELELTALGAHLAALPVDVRIGKLILFGAIFCCVDSALTMAACLSYKNPFVAPFGKKEQADAKKKEFSVGNSDQLTVLKAYKKWLDAFSQSKCAGQVFANENYLSHKSLVMLADIKHQLLELLVSIGFVPALRSIRRARGMDKVLDSTGPDLNCNGDNQKLLSAILCAALYPNVVKVLTPEKSFQVSAGGAIPRQPKSDELRFKTKQDGFVCIHPTSVNHSTCHFTSPYLVYQEKVKTSRIFIRDCSMVPLLPFVIFSGCQLCIELHRGTFVVSLEDGWIMFQVETHEVAEMLNMIRSELISLLEEKIKDPCLNLLNHNKGNRIIKTIIQIITKD